MKHEQRKTIEGVTFCVTPLGYGKARKAFVRLTKAVGPALASGAGVKPEDMDVQAILGALVDNVDDSDLEWFAEAFGTATKFSTDGDKFPFLRGPEREVLFTGRLLLFFQWLAFALEVNFSDFLDFLKSADQGGGPVASAQSDLTD